MSSPGSAPTGPQAPSVDLLPEFLARTGAAQDGEPFVTAASLLCPVTWRGAPAMLKATDAPEELRGVDTLTAWAGRGAVRVLQRSGGATILERAGATLRACEPDDGVRTATLTRALRALHSHREPDESSLVPLRRHLRALLDSTDPRFGTARLFARDLLQRNEDPVVLHGDVHAENLLASDRGWLFIDPKGLVGPRAFDHANIFTNWTLPEATEHFAGRVAIVCREAALREQTMLQWIVVWSAVSGIWHLEDAAPDAAQLPHTIMRRALELLARPADTDPSGLDLGARRGPGSSPG